MNLKISRIELKSIKQALPELTSILKEDEILINSGTYNKIFISVFDHWLTNDETDKFIFIDGKKEELKSRREKFEIVIKELYTKTDVYTWRYKRNKRVFIQRPQTINDVLRKCDFKNLWSQSGKRYSFILPEFSAIYNEEWDWTNIIWYTDEEKIKPILEIAEKAGLHILK